LGPLLAIPAAAGAPPADRVPPVAAAATGQDGGSPCGGWAV